MANYYRDDPWADTAIDLSLYRLLPMAPVEMDFIVDSEILKMAFYTGDLPMDAEILILTDECGLTDSKII